MNLASEGGWDLAVIRAKDLADSRTECKWVLESDFPNSGFCGDGPNMLEAGYEGS
jgi:hypothetical protein